MVTVHRVRPGIIANLLTVREVGIFRLPETVIYLPSAKTISRSCDVVRVRVLTFLLSRVLSILDRRSGNAWLIEAK